MSRKRRYGNAIANWIMECGCESEKKRPVAAMVKPELFPGKK